MALAQTNKEKSLSPKKANRQMCKMFKSSKPSTKRKKSSRLPSSFLRLLLAIWSIYGFMKDKRDLTL
jgi:hypothetical protein